VEVEVEVEVEAEAEAVPRWRPNHIEFICTRKMPDLQSLVTLLPTLGGLVCSPINIRTVDKAKAFWVPAS